MYNNAIIPSTWRLLDQIQRFKNNITQYRVIKHVYIQHTKKRTTGETKVQRKLK